MGLFDLPEDAKHRLDCLIGALNRMSDNMGRLAQAVEKQNEISQNTGTKCRCDTKPPTKEGGTA